MSSTKTNARDLLRRHGLRATAPRLAVVLLLSDRDAPLSHSEVLRALGDTDWDPATIYRNLVKLTEAGVARVVNHAGGRARYELVGQNAEADHGHPHFVCNDCGTVSCLPETEIPLPQPGGRWGEAVLRASIQLEGDCPDCLERHPV